MNNTPAPALGKRRRRNRRRDRLDDDDPRALDHITPEPLFRTFRATLALVFAVCLLVALLSENRAIRGYSGSSPERQRQKAADHSDSDEVVPERQFVVENPYRRPGGATPNDYGEDDYGGEEARHARGRWSRGYFDALRAEYNDAWTEPEWSGRCLINVHGIHHSGTGFARNMVYESLGGLAMVSKMVRTTKGQGEGQHQQSVYPTDLMRAREKSLCLNDTERADPRAWGKLWYCPSLLLMPEPDKTSKRLLEQWSEHWDMSKTYFIQKNPTMDVLYLEQIRMMGINTFHVIVMRHPFAAHPYDWTPHYPDVLSYEAKSLLFVWLDIWTHLLEQLAEGRVAKHIVLQYEAMLGLWEQTSAETSTLIREGCNVKNPEISKRKRRLEYHNDFTLPTEKVSTRKKMVKHQSACVEHNTCLSLMNDLAPIILEFGYSWDISVFFQPKRPVLFSFKNQPAHQLVQHMKSLVSKYESLEW